MSQEIKIGIADDQQLFLRSLSALINGFDGLKVIIEALNGEELIARLRSATDSPDIILLDVRMPVMDGIQTAATVKTKFPMIKMAALSMKDDDESVINMFKAGCCAYLLKDIDPPELEKALVTIHTDGYYNADMINKNLRRLICKDLSTELNLTERERAFLKLACSDMTYREIASRMCLSEKTVDGYRESVFIKLNVKSRVGMALEAIRQNLVAL